MWSLVTSVNTLGQHAPAPGAPPAARTRSPRVNLQQFPAALPPATLFLTWSIQIARHPQAAGECDQTTRADLVGNIEPA